MFACAYMFLRYTHLGGLIAGGACEATGHKGGEERRKVGKQIVGK